MRFSYRFNPESFDKQAKFLIKMLDLKLYQAIKQHFILEHKLANQVTYDILDDVLKVLDGELLLESFEKEPLLPYLCFLNTKNAQLLHAGGSQFYQYYANHSETCSANKSEFRNINVVVDENMFYDDCLIDALIFKVLEIVREIIKYHDLQSKRQIPRLEFKLTSAIFFVLDGYQHTYHIKPFITFKTIHQTSLIAGHSNGTDFYGRNGFHSIY